MPRNSQGLYTLPLPPVRAGELVESAWANTTLDDLASAMTGSLPRDGSAPMVGPLILRNAPPTQPREAISKQYLEQFLAYATGMPVGAVFAFASASNPAGYLLCNGQAVSRTVYAALFAAIGTTFGSGDGATTFNVPDMRDWFVRGRGDSRQLGSTQTGAIQSHTHVVQDPGHNHGASQAAHAHTTAAHSHGVNDPGHHHSYGTIGGTGVIGFGAGGGYTSPADTSNNPTGISLQSAAPNTDSQQPAVAVAGNTTGVAIGSTGEGETRPQNIALDYYIKAIDDTTQVTALTGITSSNVQQAIEELDLETQVGLSAKAPLSAGTAAGTSFTPTGSISALNVQDAIVEVKNETASLSDALPIMDGAANAGVGTAASRDDHRHPTDTSRAPVSAMTATGTSFTPSGSIAATNVQAAIQELDAEKVAIAEFIGDNQSLVGSGYQKLPGGLILQWWTANIGITIPNTRSQYTASIPEPFPNATLHMSISPINGLSDNSPQGQMNITGWTKSIFTLSGFSSYATTLTGAVFAIGY